MEAERKEALDAVAGSAILWIDWHTGKPHANPMASSLHAAPYWTRSPELGWSLYSRWGSRWETRTRREFPPAPGMQPKRTAAGWIWVFPNATVSATEVRL